MRRNDRLLGPLLTIVVLAAPPLITGCATHETYYDADYRDYHRWNGDEVTLFGGGCAPSIEEMAAQLETIPHEVTCAIARRVPRVFLKGGKIVEIRDYLRG